AMNEMPLGFDWPRASERLARTREAVEMIEQLWLGGFVNFSGKYYNIRNAKLYTPPTGKVPLYMAASGEHSATVAGSHCDGLITFLKPDEVGKMFSAFDKAAREN